MAVVTVPIADLRTHPQNYRAHPPDQIAHLAASIRDNGVYRNVVAARDLTLLAGHGVVQAATSLGLTEVPVHVLDLDPLEPRALKILAGDNEVQHLVESDDRALADLLRAIAADDIGLLGTGYDELMLANLVMVTRPASEIADFDEAAEWAGMPEYDPGEPIIKLSVSFRSDADRTSFIERNQLTIQGTGATPSAWWPARARDDLVSLRFEG